MKNVILSANRSSHTSVQNHPKTITWKGYSSVISYNDYESTLTITVGSWPQLKHRTPLILLNSFSINPSSDTLLNHIWALYSFWICQAHFCLRISCIVCFAYKAYTPDLPIALPLNLAPFFLPLALFHLTPFLPQFFCIPFPTHIFIVLVII